MMDGFTKYGEKGQKQMFKCAYCGKEYVSVLERTKCEIACGEKLEQELNKKVSEEKEHVKKDKVAYVISLWKKVSDAFELAKKAEDELHKNYPDVVIAKPTSIMAYMNSDNSNTFNVTINGNKINDENVTSEMKKLFTDYRTNNFARYNWLDMLL